MDHNPPELAYSAIGQQNVGTTALQNALIAAGVANGGKVMAPHLVEQVRDQNGNAVYTWHPRVWKQAMSPGAAAILTPIMENVAAYGTAAGVFPWNLHVAAKTGTAQAGYPVVTNTHDWMIAFAPNPNPEIAVAVVVPWQPISDTGAVVAGPIMRCMVEGAVAYEAHQPVSGTSSTCP
jgi:peptidoglycan glycosyltransferase